MVSCSHAIRLVDFCKYSEDLLQSEDNGSNLVGRETELKDLINNSKKDEIVSYLFENVAEWRFTPAEAAWMNGVTESMVKSVKRAIKIAIGSQVMKFSVMLTIIRSGTQLVNSRPMGKHPNNPEEGYYLCPNDLLLGLVYHKVGSRIMLV